MADSAVGAKKFRFPRMLGPRDRYLATGRRLQELTLDGPISASPVVVNGRVLIGTQKGTLYCLGEKK